MRIKTMIAGLKDELVALRRDFHAHPELGFQEFRTSEMIRRCLAQEGMGDPRVDAAFGCHLWSQAAAGTIDIRPGPIMAGEDFSEFAACVPAAFAFVGIRNAADGIVFPHHHPQFTIDEAALATGAELYVRAAMSFLEART